MRLYEELKAQDLVSTTTTFHCSGPPPPTTSMYYVVVSYSSTLYNRWRLKNKEPSHHMAFTFDPFFCSTSMYTYAENRKHEYYLMLWIDYSAEVCSITIESI